MKDEGHDFVGRIHREAWERYRHQPPPSLEPPTIHYTELPPSKPGSAIAEEWETYRREVGRLLAEGHEGQYVLIKGGQILGIWDREQDALATAYQKFLLQPFLVRQLLEREQILRIGYNKCYVPTDLSDPTKRVEADRRD